MKRYAIVLAAAFLLIFGVNYSYSYVIVDDNNQFEIAIPDNAIDFPEGYEDGVLYAYKIPMNDSHGSIIAIQIEGLGGVIGRGDISKTLTNTPNIELFRERWKSFDIDVYKIIRTYGDNTAVAYVAQVPTVPQAIQLRIGGLAGHEEEMIHILRTSLSSLEGNTNWLTDGERRMQLVIGTVKLLLSISAVLVVIGIVRKKRS